MPLVAAEELVPAVTAERDGDTLAGECRHAIGRDRRVVDDRLVVALDDAREQLGRVGDAHGALCEIRSQRFGCEPCEAELALLLDVEADRECLRTASVVRAHLGEDRRAVETTGEEEPQGNVRYEMRADGLCEAPLQPFDRVAGITDLARIRRVPVLGDAEPPCSQLEGQLMAGRQLRDSGDGATVMRNVAVRQVVERGVLVDGGLPSIKAMTAFSSDPKISRTPSQE